MKAVVTGDVLHGQYDIHESRQALSEEDDESSQIRGSSFATIVLDLAVWEGIIFAHVYYRIKGLADVYELHPYRVA